MKKIWTLELSKEVALKYKTRTELLEHEPGCYNFCVKNNLLDIVCKHMKMKWTKELAKQEALKYKTRVEFKKAAPTCVCFCRRNNILDEVCHFMSKRITWTIELAKQEALKYNTRTEFSAKSSGCYDFCQRKGVMDIVCEHMKQECGNRFFRHVYIFEFNDNHVYIGLTYNIEERYYQHTNKNKSVSPVYNHIEKTNNKFVFKVITDKPINVDDAQKLEHETINKYKDNGWFILNKGKTGKGSSALGGGVRKWTFEMCKNEALKYKTRTEFHQKCGSAYSVANENGWLNEICSHMKIKNSWTNKESCRIEALKYLTRIEFQTNSPGACASARQNKWIDEICTHMIVICKPKGYWKIKENCVIEALKYNNRTDFKQNCFKGYEHARQNNWLDEICSHMGKPSKPKGYWKIKENCAIDALKYSKRTDFQKYNYRGYTSARQNNWLDEICSHMN